MHLPPQSLAVVKIALGSDDWKYRFEYYEKSLMAWVKYVYCQGDKPSEYVINYMLLKRFADILLAWHNKLKDSLIWD